MDLSVFVSDGNGNGQGDVCVGISASDTTSVIGGTPPNPTTTPSSGSLGYTVTDSAVGLVTYTLTDYGVQSGTSGTCDNSHTLGTFAQTVTIDWFPPPTEATLSTVTASPGTVLADGHSSATVTVVMNNANDVAEIGRLVTLGCGACSAKILPRSEYTGAGGRAQFTVSDFTAETAKFSVSGVNQTAEVDFVSAAQSELADSTVSASLARINNDGLATSTITVTLADSGGPLAGRTVALCQEPLTAYVDPFTHKTVVLNPTAVIAPAGEPTLSQPAACVAGTSPPIPASSVTATTDGAGQAVFTVIDGNPETVTFQATDSTSSLVVGTASVRFGDASPFEAGNSVVSTTPSGNIVTSTSVPDDGTTAAGVFVQLVCNDGGNGCNSAGSTLYNLPAGPMTGTSGPAMPVGYAAGTYTQTVQGADVALVPTGNSSATVTSVLNPTDANGTARFQVTDTKAESVTFNVYDLTNNLELNNGAASPSPLTVTIDFTGAGAPSPVSSTATASPTSVPANGTTPSTITVTLRDANGMVVPNQNVTVTPTGGSATVSPGSATTNASGVATFTTVDTHVETVSYLIQDVAANLVLATFPTVSFTAGTASASASSISASPPTVPADGSTQSAVTVKITDSGGNPLAGKTVTLSQDPAGGSTISAASGPTSAQGITTFTVTDATPQTVTYTAKDSTDGITLTHTAAVTFVGLPTSANSTVVASPPSVPANSLAVSEVTVTLKDANGNPVAGKTVSLAAVSGASTITNASPGSDVSNANGQATFYVTDGTAEVVTYAATDATDSVPLSATATVTFTGAPSGSLSTVTASPPNAATSGPTGTGSVVTVTLLDGLGHPISGHTIALSAGAGSSVIVPASNGSAVTNASGVATFKVTDPVAESVTYSASDTTAQPAQQIFATATVTFTNAPTEASTSTVTAQPSTVPANGTAHSTVTVTLLDGSGTAIPGHLVSLAGSAGTSSKIAPASAGSATTDTSGVATFDVSDTAVESVTYTATDTTAAPVVVVAQTATVSFVSSPSEANQSTVSALPTSVPADGKSASTVTVTLHDASGTPIPNHMVSLAGSAGTSSTIASASAGSATTNSSGVATFDVTDATVEPVTYTATDATVSPNVVVAQTAQVNFTTPSDEASASTISASPPSVPADGVSSSKIVVSLVGNSGPIAGDNVVLTAKNGISTINIVTDPTGADGNAVFTVTDTTPENVVYTATDTTTGVTLDQTATVGFDEVVLKPVVTGVSPNLGSNMGGTQVTISGQGFAGATAVMFGTSPGKIVSIAPSGDSIVVTAPAGRGSVDVTVTTPNGTSAVSNADLYSFGRVH